MKKDRKLIIGIIIIGAFISSLNQTVMTASLPRIMEEFGIGAGIGQWLTTAYLLFMGIMIPCTGFLMEKYSSRKLYLTSVSLFLAGCLLASFSPNIYLLLAARVIQALGAGILLPLPQVVAFRLYEPEQRGAIMGIVGLTTGFAPAFGPTFAGWVVDSFSWRSIFYIMSVLSAAAILLAIVKLPKEEISSEQKLDLLSVIFSTVGFCGLLTGATNQGNYGISSPLAYVPFLIGILCVALFAARQLRLPSPLLELRVFQSRNFTFGTLLLVFAYGSMMSVSTLLPVYIQTLRGYSATMSGLIMLPGALFLAFLNPVTGRILDKRGPFLLSVGGLLCLGAATFALAFAGETTPLIYVMVAYGVRMLGIVALLQPLQTWAVNAVESRFVAHATALMNTVRQVGGAIVSAVFVTVMSAASKAGGDMQGIQVSFQVTAVVVFLCLIVVVLFMRSRESGEKETAVPAPTESSRPEHTVITIAREYGSGGREIGARVAEKLGIPLYDRELIALAAKESGLSGDYIAAREERTSAGDTLWDFMAQSYGIYESRLYESGNYSAVDQLFEAQSRLLRSLAEKGSCVMIGRCSDWLLRDMPGCMRIFILSDMEHRLRRIEEEYHVPKEHAAEEARRKDQERARHYKRYTHNNWGEPSLYHMVLNSGAVGIEECARLIAAAVGGNRYGV